MRRKSIIRNSFSDTQLFENHRRRFARKFSELSHDLEDKIQEAIATHLAVIQNDLDTLKNENVALESERHPEFRRQLEEAVRDMRQKMEDACPVVSHFRMPAV
jgi:FtsZ-binding cell division protein ZapB